MKSIYLDSNATSPMLPEAFEAMRPLLAAESNASSSHAFGRQARRHLEDARDRIAALLGAKPGEVLFTSGATEANNLALFGSLPNPKGTRILALRIEHPCVIEPLKILAEAGAVVEWLPVNGRGIVEFNGQVGNLSPHFIALMLMNHETGAIQPVGAACRAAQGVHFHTDAAQAVGKIPVHFQRLGVTTLSASAHKFRGPPGIGLLLVKEGVKLKPMLFGGHQQRGQRPGTEPVALAVGMAVALEHAVANMESNTAKCRALIERFLVPLRRELGSRVVVNGQEPGSADAGPTTLNVSFLGCRAELLLMALDLAGVACSTGSACSSGSLLPSPVLQAMGVPDEVLQSAMRFSFSPTLDESDVDDAAARVVKVVLETAA